MILHSAFPLLWTINLGERLRDLPSKDTTLTHHQKRIAPFVRIQNALGGATGYATALLLYRQLGFLNPWTGLHGLRA